MTTMHSGRESANSPIIATNQVVGAAGGATGSSALLKALAALRIAFGVTFLWAFFDKLLALGFSTGAVTNEAGVKTGTDFFAKDSAWLNGGSPTEGFLGLVSPNNPFQGMFNSMAGDTWVNVLFMVGLLGIGIALTFGIGMRVGAACGALDVPVHVRREPPAREQPGGRRPPHRRDLHGRSGSHACRRHLGIRPGLGEDGLVQEHGILR